MAKQDKKYMLFSNGTEFERWSERNCDRCFKASKYNEKTDTYTKYRCAIQKHIDEAFIGDGRGNKRDYEATHQADCPYRKTERKQYAKRDKYNENQLTLQFD